MNVTTRIKGIRFVQCLMLQNFTPRLYQQTMYANAVKQNTLAVLPTGLGKTALALMMAVHRHKKGKILVMSPTKPLCQQHHKTFSEHLTLPTDMVSLLTGSVKPEKREIMWDSSKIIISTPQGIENDVLNNRISFKDVSLIVFDEAHHARGNYSYCWLAKRYMETAQSPHILALSASPGSTKEDVQEVCDNLFIEHVDVRSYDDPDVKQYVQDVKIDWVPVNFPSDWKPLHRQLKLVYDARVKQLQSILSTTHQMRSKGDLLKIQRKLQGRLKDSDETVWQGLSYVAEAIKVEYSIELLECQGVMSCKTYLDDVVDQARRGKVKAVKRLIADVEFVRAIKMAGDLENHQPKLDVLCQKLEGVKGLVLLFANYRDTGARIIERLREEGYTADLFVGQAKKKGLGLSQKQQKAMLDRFRAKEFQILVATSVAEEGLDIPAVDNVFFYEPTPSAIRNIQRRGRTGRHNTGHVYVLFMKGTRDEAYRYISKRRESKMQTVLKSFKNDLVLPQKSLSDYVQLDHTIIADHREKDNILVKKLVDKGVRVKVEQLEYADYIIDGQIAVEFKQAEDFVGSLLDGRLMKQLSTLKSCGMHVVLLVQGGDLYSVRKVHPGAIRGALASIAIDFQVPILHSKDYTDSCELLLSLAKRCQSSVKREVSLHQSKPQSLIEQQEYIIQSFPGVGPKAARLLLQRFGCVWRIVTASERELLSVPGIGKKTVDQIRIVSLSPYGK